MRYKTGVLGKIYLWIILALLYLPIVTVVAYSFNDAKSSAVLPNDSSFTSVPCRRSSAPMQASSSRVSKGFVR